MQSISMSNLRGHAGVHIFMVMNYVALPLCVAMLLFGPTVGYFAYLPQSSRPSLKKYLQPFHLLPHL
jgi:hypothetical protein